MTDNSKWMCGSFSCGQINITFTYSVRQRQLLLLIYMYDLWVNLSLTHLCLLYLNANVYAVLPQKSFVDFHSNC